MTRIAGWMVVRDDAYYVDMAVKSMDGHVDGFFVLDTGSVDETPEILKTMAENFKSQMIVERKSFGGLAPFSKDYREAEARNYALDRATELFSPDWLVQIDSDEIFNSRYWEIFCTIQDRDDAENYGHSTHEGITLNAIYNGPECHTVWGDHLLYDPHIRAWRARKKVRWVKLQGRHVIPMVEGEMEDLPFSFVTGEQVHFHLKRSFGPKSILYWMSGWRDGGMAMLLKEFGLMTPELFKALGSEMIRRQFFGSSFKTGKFVHPDHELSEIMKNCVGYEHPLPEFVKEKWREWGGA